MERMQRERNISMKSAWLGRAKRWPFSSRAGNLTRNFGPLLLVAILLWAGLQSANASDKYYPTAPDANAGCLADGAVAKVHATMVKEGYNCPQGYYIVRGKIVWYFVCHVYGHQVSDPNYKFSQLPCGLYDSSTANNHYANLVCENGQYWDPQTRQCGKPNEDKNLGVPPCKDGCFQGINGGTGNRVEVTADYLGTGLLPLVVKSTYNSAVPAHPIEPSRQILGKKRAYQYVQSIRKVSFPGEEDTAYFTHEDGRVSRFYRSGQNWVPFGGSKLRLSASYGVGGDVSEWRLSDGEGLTYKFQANGRLIEISNRQGGSNSLVYDSKIGRASCRERV